MNFATMLSGILLMGDELMKAVNIMWVIDQDEYDSVVLLPMEITIPKHITDIDEISDYLSDTTGFLHEGFSLTE